MKKYNNIKEVDDVGVQFAANGFILKFDGNDENGDWESFIHVTHSFDEVVEIIKHFSEARSLV